MRSQLCCTAIQKMEEMKSITCAVQFNSIDKMFSEVSLTFQTQEICEASFVV